jgi:hypothetical protein
VSVDSAQNIGKAKAILHNFVCKRDGFRFEDALIYKRVTQDIVQSEASSTGKTPENAMQICVSYTVAL